MAPPARLAAALAVAVLAAPAAAFVRSADELTGAELFWPVPVVPYHVSDAPSFPSPTCAPGAGGDPGLAAVQEGFAAWRTGCSNLDLVYSGRIGEIRTGMGGTGENLVVFRKGWCRATLPPGEPCLDDPDVDCGGIHGCFEDDGPGSRLIVALTSVLYEPDTGRIVDADIEVNGWDGEGEGESVDPGAAAPPHGWYFTCVDPADAPVECAIYGQAGCHFVDLQNTLTHEAGHFLGLAHPCEGATCTPALQPLTMYPATAPGDVEKRTLHADDVAGVCAIYPRPDSGCGCGAGGAPGVLAALLGAAALWPRRPRRTPRRHADQATIRPA